ncbi:hypothetical protein JOC70_002293 [Clostridium pascui]|uniref:DUF3892 domain-containing protein n=1 Tax=Clostridium pascui TaxID=46609 RepID=UPI00195BAB90|nr:DUF3892 domain-containing protein [Clostridium pascui]MBM7870799.1 hypothetical protein [Clostridium pascui]
MNKDSSSANNIVAVGKDSDNEIVSYKLDNGEILSRDQAISMAKEGGLKGVSVAKSRKGEEYLRSLPDDDESNNLKNLPNIEE